MLSRQQRTKSWTTGSSSWAGRQATQAWLGLTPGDPVALGGGLPLFKDLPKPLRLNLTEARTFPDGTAIHVYQPVKEG